MSNKFEKLLDYLVNEEMDKANELFHEIIVEKSRQIYTDLIAEEMDLDLESDEDEEEMDEGAACDTDEYEDESIYEIGGDPSDDFVSDVEDGGMGDDDMDDMGDDDMDDMGDDDMDDMGDDDMDDMGDEEDEVTHDDLLDIKDDIAQLKAEFEALLSKQDEGDEEDMDMDDEDEEDMDMDDEDEEGEEEDEDEDDEEMDEQFVREYRETVKKPSKSETAVNARSPVSSANGRPGTNANARGILQGSTEGTHSAPRAKGEYTKGVTQNMRGQHSGVKSLKKVGKPHGGEQG